MGFIEQVSRFGGGLSLSSELRGGILPATRGTIARGTYLLRIAAH
jgi:hypothetical protein